MAPPRRSGNGHLVAVRAHHYCLSADLEPLLQLDELLRRVVMGSTLHLELQFKPNTAWVELLVECMDSTTPRKVGAQGQGKLRVCAARRRATCALAFGGGAHGEQTLTHCGWWGGNLRRA